MTMYHLVIRSAVKRAKKIIAVSDFTKEDIKKELNVDEKKIVVTKEGFDSKTSFGEGDFRTIFKKYGIIGSYLLYVGNAYPHKNLEKLCEAFVKIKQKYPELQLVIVGGEDYFFNRLKQYIKNKQIKGILFPGFVSDYELDAFYRGAEVFVFPSLYEGFGLPPLEALARDVVVVSSNCTSMPEVLGNAAQYFNPESIDSMTENIIKALSLDNNKKTLLIEKGKERLKFFSWKKMAQETLDVYKNCVM